MIEVAAAKYAFQDCRRAEENSLLAFLDADAGRDDRARRTRRRRPPFQKDRAREKILSPPGACRDAPIFTISPRYLGASHEKRWPA